METYEKILAEIQQEIDGLDKQLYLQMITGLLIAQSIVVRYGEELGAEISDDKIELIGMAS